ncbi:polyphosphate kinase 1 [Prochlorococcus marinus str. MU1404]|uniref:polyphosphate kinase 1 n=1 Tax=Prochlorococcus marinus TaxID=1219 RepID=UPI001ADC6246|nr:polyphosphate kinase 1 [Prochlorococcus marinus]MBO8230996.1 polyphosphate kinase 1 [Prochlorococcus marinus XMU1404]MBW3074028.1 polyphosphate kinase 1 [Prochlorococcus marinus str. MU1404]MCR8544672.1 polyphosphate kinase 1 [Prochlorococcus marinus CUG1432]
MEKQGDIFINRELSWIEFNKRVLLTGMEKKYKILDKVKFCSIFSNNLDEFFMVRVASLKAQVEAGITKKSIDGLIPKEQLTRINKEVKNLTKLQENYVNNELNNELKKERIFIKKYKELSENQKNWSNNYFSSSIFPLLTPLVIDPAHPFPFISNLSLNLAAIIKNSEDSKQQFVRIKIPTKNINRFIRIPNEIIEIDDKNTHFFISVEDLIGNNINSLFNGMECINYSFFRVTRDADLELKELEADDLLLAVEQSLQKRRLGGDVVRLEVESDIPKNILRLLIKSISIQEEYIYFCKSLLGLDDLNQLTKIHRDDLKENLLVGKTHHLLKDLNSPSNKNFNSIFKILRKKDVLLHHPYDLFKTSVEEFINRAADDPLVMAIKITLYRVSKDSPIIAALMRAAENGKEVMTLVELKARFDEDNNIQWAKQLEQAGVHVVYGIIGFKTHTKIALIVRKEKGSLRNYFHIGTGNYNSNTSMFYTDLGLLSTDPEIASDLLELFNYLSGFSKQKSFKKLLVSPSSLREKFIFLIKREIKHAKQGKKAEIIAKMNSLVDTEIIELLYLASQSGVKISLIIRGICCLYPQRKNLSENIKVISIIGHFLEHSRIFWFCNDDNVEVFIGSADWMKRNLDRRIEAITPIEDLQLKSHIYSLLQTYIKDNYFSWSMKEDGSYEKNILHSDIYRSQIDLINK